MLLHACFLSTLATLTTCQSCLLDRYKKVENFTCDATTETSLELVNRTTETGTVVSPCYGHKRSLYPEEQVAGQKLMVIRYHYSSVVGYRLRIRHFHLAEGDRLYIGNETQPFAGNCRTLRQLALLSNSTTDRLVYLKDERSGSITKTLSLDGDNVVDLPRYQQVFIDFYTVEDSDRGRGFLIDYAADIDECSSIGGNVFCKNGGVCTRMGFNDAVCNCTGTGYEGTVCTDDIDECTNTSSCDADATCVNSPGSFTCTCNPGYTGDGKTCTGPPATYIVIAAILSVLFLIIITILVVYIKKKKSQQTRIHRVPNEEPPF